MKHRIFELYRSQSLKEFLTFHKENPKENFVYVLQHPPQNINILTASDFGYLVICQKILILCLVHNLLFIK